MLHGLLLYFSLAHSSFLKGIKKFTFIIGKRKKYIIYSIQVLILLLILSYSITIALGKGGLTENIFVTFSPDGE